MTLTRTASTSAQVLAMELGITDTAKKAKVFDLILALLTLERERDGWQPIKTAPRDGTPILLFCPPTEELSGHRKPDEIQRELITTGYWHEHYEEWHLCVSWGYECESVPYEKPTHWQSLPSPLGASE